MTLFWVVAACLVGAALLFVIPPLFFNGIGRRKDVVTLERSRINVTIYKNQLTELETDLAAGDIDQAHYDKSRQEIERRLLEDTAVAEQATGSSGKTLNIVTTAVVALAVPLVAVSIYLKVGNPAAMDPAAQAPQQAEAGPHGQNGADMQAQIEGMVGKLAQRLEENPADIEGWVMLGRSFSVLGRYDEAAASYEKAISVVGEDATLLADYADAIAMSNGESLEGKPMELLQKALNIDPQNQKALWLLGTAHFERGDFTSAINLWKRLQQLIPTDSEDATAMAANIAEAESYRQRQLKGEFGKAPAPAVDAAAAVPEKKAVSQITGKVTLSPALASKVAPGDTLFIFAKAVSGPPMPLAIVKAQAGALPMEFKLDESQAMMPNMSLANFNQVIVGARISKTGDAMPKSGDLQGGSKTPVAVGSSGLNIQIDTVVP
jgi:cytochrome c-type biogenesis protein CcmH